MEFDDLDEVYGEEQQQLYIQLYTLFFIGTHR
jgi:hypothetical protein